MTGWFLSLFPHKARLLPFGNVWAFHCRRCEKRLAPRSYARGDDQ